VTASYDGHVRCYDQSRNMVNNAPLHLSAITSLCVVPDSNLPPDMFKVATSSHDLAQLTQLSISTDLPPVVKPLCTLHLHTAPVSSVSSNSSGSHLLTSSWDRRIGVWDTQVSSSDDVLLDPSESIDRNKRRKVTNDSERAKRKAPVSVLESHTARVSKVVFGKDTGNSRSAYSCGFDSTVRSWDIESGVCVDTIVRDASLAFVIIHLLLRFQSAAEKLMLDMTLTSDERMALTASTDGTISVYDLRNHSATLKPAVLSLSHPETPLCVVTAPTHASAHHIMSGAYDGVVRLWDLRSAKSALIMFKAWNGEKKILGLDWYKSTLGIGGEGGMEIWRIGTLPSSQRARRQFKCEFPKETRRGLHKGNRQKLVHAGDG
jgi:ribosome biogenesis protein YTM1